MPAMMHDDQFCLQFLGVYDGSVFFCSSVGGGRQYPVSIDPIVGEVIEAARVSESKFNSLQSLFKKNI